MPRSTFILHASLKQTLEKSFTVDYLICRLEELLFYGFFMNSAKYFERMKESQNQKLQAAP